MPLPLDLPEGGERVGRLAGLGDREQERALVDRRVAVAEFARILHLDRKPGELLDQILTDERGVPARAAAGEDDPVDVLKLCRREVEAAEHGGRVIP